nr:MAG TPA: hypothetical protein [Caudoviricetes sp.]DAQ91698.1 MAG TPA: hypothetical protein [Caudoviricetes sp.]
MFLSCFPITLFVFLIQQYVSIKYWVTIKGACYCHTSAANGC